MANNESDKISELKILLNNDLLTEDEYSTLINELKSGENSKSNKSLYIVGGFLISLIIVVFYWIHVTDNGSAKYAEGKAREDSIALANKTMLATQDSITKATADSLKAAKHLAYSCSA